VSAKAGVVALGDSITYGHGGMQSGLGCQSWAMWLAEALELPFTRLATNGATAPDVVREQLPRLRRDHDLGCLYVGVNDVRNAGWDPAAYERDLTTITAALAARADRLVVCTIPRDLGLPPAGAKVEDANAAIERVAAAHGAVVADLRDFTGRAWVWADRVHATATGEVEIADRAARALGTPPPSQTVVDPPSPDALYAYHYARRSIREHARAARQRIGR
jgi:lysophospholipase L1-like esterase